MITKPRIKSTTDLTVKPVGAGKHKKVSPQEVTTNTTVKNNRKIVSSEYKGVTNPLSGVTGVSGTIELSDKINNISGVTGVFAGVTLDELHKSSEPNERLAGVTATLSGVTITNSPKKHPVMSDKEITTQEGENSMLQAIARLETKPLENREQDLTRMEERLTASMKTIVNSSIQEALKNITSSITKAVAEDPEIKKQKHNISQLQTENLRLTRKVQVLDSEYNKLKTRINTIEQKSLDHTLIIRGIVENQEETETSMKDSIFGELSETVVGETYEEKINTVRCMEIK